MTQLPEWLEKREASKRTFWEDARKTFDENLEYAIRSLQAYGQDYPKWQITYSGGKDSSAVLGLVIYAIESGQLKAPEQLTILYADTQRELPPLHITAMQTLAACEQRGYNTVIVTAPIEKTFYVQVLGRGLPYPTNRRRWCTRVLKKDPMDAYLNNADGLTLSLTGVRKGESAARDGRISTSCSTGDGECGQGWYQQSQNALAPLLTWRQCHIWRWLYSADNPFPITRDIQAVYRADDFTDIRTGCMECEVVTEDYAFKYLIKTPEWSWLAPYHRLVEVREWLMQPAQRHRKTEITTNADGKLRDKRGAPLGPITLEARTEGLRRILEIQDEVRALSPDGKGYDVITPAMHALILEMIEARTFPQGWTGNEPSGNEAYTPIFIEGGVLIGKQPRLL